jgi:hypothetical protein
MQEQDSPQVQPSPPAEKIVAEEAPQMSEVATLGNIFIEPGRTFEDLRRKPRFILAAIIMALLITAFSFAVYYKVGEANFRDFYEAQIDKNPRTASMPRDAKESAVNMTATVGTVVRYGMPVLVLIIFAIGGLIYWLAGKAFGGTGGYLHGLSTWVYSSFPPAVAATIAGIIVLALKNVDDIDIGATQGEGAFLPSSLAFFVDGKTMPVIASLLSNFDVFLIWGWVLAAIGLQRTQRISSGSAWAIVIILAVIGAGFKLLRAAFA